MLNLSLGSKARYLVGATLGLLLFMGLLMSRPGPLSSLVWWIFALETLLLLLLTYTVHRILVGIKTLTSNLRRAAEGDLDQRITGIKAGAATGGQAWALNDLLDQQEAYFREVSSAFEHASRGQTYRLAMDQGLHGSFRDAMHKINVSVSSLGQVQQMALKEKLIARITDLNSGNLIGNLKSIQEYLVNMTQELGQVAQLSNVTAQEAQDSRAIIESLVTNLDEVVRMVAATNTQIALLHEKSDEINQIVQVITDVADRTNLLALNAAIEAAHAGDVGKGFAVVAEEVRTLSENTKDAAASIAMTIESFGQATSRMIEDSARVKELTEGSQSAVTDFRTQVLKFADSAKTSFIQINKAQDSSFASLVKMDHFLYKQNGYRVLYQGTNSVEAKAIQVDHFGCRLGTWYYEGHGKTHFSHVPSFGRLEAPHAGVHTNIREAVTLLGQHWDNDPELQQRIYDHFAAAEKASDNVVETIDRMVEERHRGSVS